MLERMAGHLNNIIWTDTSLPSMFAPMTHAFVCSDDHKNNLFIDRIGISTALHKFLIRAVRTEHRPTFFMLKKIVNFSQTAPWIEAESVPTTTRRRHTYQSATHKHYLYPHRRAYDMIIIKTLVQDQMNYILLHLLKWDSTLLHYGYHHVSHDRTPRQHAAKKAQSALLCRQSIVRASSSQLQPPLTAAGSWYTKWTDSFRPPVHGSKDSEMFLLASRPSPTFCLFLPCLLLFRCCCCCGMASCPPSAVAPGCLRGRYLRLCSR
jgi:hypothetical protein